MPGELLTPSDHMSNCIRADSSQSLFSHGMVTCWAQFSISTSYQSLILFVFCLWDLRLALELCWWGCVALPQPPKYEDCKPEPPCLSKICSDFFPFQAEHWTRGLTHTRQALWTTTPRPLLVSKLFYTFLICTQDLIGPPTSEGHSHYYHISSPSLFLSASFCDLFKSLWWVDLMVCP